MSTTINIDSAEYPDWWESATTVTVLTTTTANVGGNTAAREVVTFLPQGVSVEGTTPTLYPWSSVAQIYKAS